MTNTIINDNISTQALASSRKSDATAASRSANRSGDDAGGPSVSDRAEVSPAARQRLTQETGASTRATIDSPAQARDRVAELVAQLAADPAAGLRAQGGATVNLFESAIARPAV